MGQDFETSVMARLQAGEEIVCEMCGDVIDESEFDKAQRLKEDLALDHPSCGCVTEILCTECVEEHKDQVGAFEGDYNDMHPNETVEEFSDHED